ncbi:DUF1616 domain-containing protein [Haloarcula laminariae]|uniref:DUF1616 domain-containing protein n=1 Tax=Haloarcula laminariae TaxID=2961577 RepID=UPI0021CA9695|nr:DUF1616 domain-containing protein [Halomicroarcula laminariae]
MTQVQSTLRDGVDLVAIVGLVALLNLVVFRPVTGGAAVRVALGTVLVLFVPGYVLLAALFPEAGQSPTDGSVSLFDKSRPERSIDGLERAALSFALSIALVPLLVFGLMVSRYAFAAVPVTVTLTLWTALLTPVAAVRRFRLPRGQRFRVPVGRWFAARTRLTGAADSRFEAALNVGLVAVVVLALGTSAFAVAAPPDGERYTEFYVTTEDGEGNLSFSDYPETVTPGEPEPMWVGIENYERDRIDYSVVVQLQRRAGGADGSAVAERETVDRFSATLGPTETRHLNRNLTVSNRLTGDDRRLVFLLYMGPVPDSPTAENAYRSVHLWVDVGTGTVTVLPDDTTDQTGPGASEPGTGAVTVLPDDTANQTSPGAGEPGTATTGAPSS